MTAKIKDHAALKPSADRFSKEWKYVLDDRPECNGIAAMHYLKSIGFSTEDAGKYMRELQGVIVPAQMSAEEERHFDNPYAP